MKLFGAIKRYLVIVAMLYVATALADTWYDESTGFTWTYRIVGDAAEIYAHWGPAVQPKPVGNLTIPSVLGDKSVVSIGNYAFSSCRDLSGVDIPNTVTNVAYNAFYDCISLTNQNGLVIVKDIVFGYYGEDEHVAIPNGVRAIGYSAFHNDAVKSISIPSSLVYIDKGGVSLSGVDSIYIDDLTAWCNLEVYGMVAESYVLYLNGLLVKNLEIPDGVTAIRDWNFAGCTSIETLHIPNSVTIIDSYPFAGCWNLVQISVDDCNNRYEVRNGVLCDRNSSSAVICPAGKQGVVHIPEGIERIYYSAFANCREISEVVIPSTIRYIDNGAFSCCTSITNIFIPKDVVRVGNNAFANCTALGNVSLPITLKDRLDSSVFWGCSKELTIDYYGEYHAVTFDSDGGTPANVTRSILDWESNGERIGDLPAVSKKGCVLDGWYDDKGEKVTSEYIVTSNITLVANWERAKCSVKFYDRYSNKIFEERIIEYGDCMGSLPDLSNEDHDGYIFSGWTCWDIDGFVTTDYVVKSSLALYAYWEFVGYTISFDLNGADTLDEIPSIVQTDDIAVDDLPVPICDNKIFLGWYEEPIGGKRIQRNLQAEKSRTLYAHWANEVTVNDVMWRYTVNGFGAEIYSCSADEESIVVPSDLDGLPVTAIGENAFRGNVALSSITIPGSVTNIGAYAFYGCTNLQEVCFNEGLVSISSGAFAYCTRLKSIEMPSTLKELGQREAKVSKAAMESIFHYGDLCSYIAVINGKSGLLDVDWDLISAKYGAEVSTNVMQTVNTEATKRTISWSKRENFGDAGLMGGEDGFSVSFTHEILGPELFPVYQADGTISYEFRVPTNDTAYGIVYYYDQGRGVFEGCECLEDIMLNKGLEFIGAGAFKDCLSLRSLTIPNSVTSIGGYSEHVSNKSWVRPYKRIVYVLQADGTYMRELQIVYDGETADISEAQGSGFVQGCTNLVDIVLPSALQYLGPYSFAGCISLGTIDLPDSLATIQHGTFSGCERLSKVKFPYSLDLIGGYEWNLKAKMVPGEWTVLVPLADGTISYERETLYHYYNTDGTISIVEPIFIPQASGIYTEAIITNQLVAASLDTRWEGDLIDIAFPLPVDDPILANGGDYLGELTYLVRSQVSEEYKLALEMRRRFSPSAAVYRKQLISHEFCPGDGVFFGCMSLGEVSLPGSVRRIGDYAFYDCPGLSLAAIPESLEAVGYKAFGGTTSLPDMGAPWQGYNDTLEALLASGRSYEEIGDIVFGLHELLSVDAVELSEADRTAIIKMAVNTYVYALRSFQVRGGDGSFTGIGYLLGALRELMMSVGGELSSDMKRQIVDVASNAAKSALDALAGRTDYTCDLNSIKSFEGIGEVLSSLAYFIDSVGAELTSSTKQRLVDDATTSACNALANLTDHASDLSRLESFEGIGEVLSSLAYFIDSVGAELTSSTKQRIVDYSTAVAIDVLANLTDPMRDLSGLESYNGIGEVLSSLSELISSVGAELLTSLKHELVVAAFAVTTNTLANLSNPYRSLSSLRSFSGIGEMMSSLSSFAYNSDFSLLSDVEKVSMAYAAAESTMSCLFNLTRPDIIRPCLQNSYGLGELPVSYAEFLGVMHLKLSERQKSELSEKMQNGVFTAIDNVLDSAMPAEGVAELYSALAECLSAVDSIPDDPIPVILDEATGDEIAEALAESADERLTTFVTNIAIYAEYRNWAQGVKGINGWTATASAAAVKASDKAWISFALGADRLIEEEITKEDVMIEAFEPSADEPDEFSFEVSIKDVNISSAADKARLATVLGIEGATSLDDSAFSSENVDFYIGTPKDGKATFTAKPKEDAKGASDAFFMRVRVNQ